MKEKLLNKIKEEAGKLEGQVYAYFVPEKDTKKTSHCEIRFIDNGKLANRGFTLRKIDNKIHNAELFENHLMNILSTIYGEIDGRLFIAAKKVKSEKFDFNFEIKPYNKKLKFFINEKLVFTLRKVKQKDGKYIVSQKAVDLSYELVEKELISIFRTTEADLTKTISLIESVVEYLLVN